MTTTTASLPVRQLRSERPDRCLSAPAPRPLRFVSFLAPNLLPVYQFIARYAGEQLGLPTELATGCRYSEVADADVSFLCGLVYVEMSRVAELPVEPLVAPVLRDDRCGGRPICWSDVIVHQHSRFRSFADLRGCSWAYNETLSQSGYGITRHRLVQLGETSGYFARVVEAGWHEVAIQLVAEGEVDASAIDAQVLAAALRDRPELADRLRIIDCLGPSSIQPLAVGRHLSPSLKADLRTVLLDMAHDPAARQHLAHGFIDRFVPVSDETYDDIRRMRDEADAANFLTLR